MIQDSVLGKMRFWVDVAWLDLKHCGSVELWSLWCSQFIFFKVHVSWIIARIMRELGMELFRQCSPPMYVDGRILPLY